MVMMEILVWCTDESLCSSVHVSNIGSTLQCMSITLAALCSAYWRSSHCKNRMSTNVKPRGISFWPSEIWWCQSEDDRGFRSWRRGAVGGRAVCCWPYRGTAVLRNFRKLTGLLYEATTQRTGTLEVLSCCPFCQLKCRTSDTNTDIQWLTVDVVLFLCLFYLPVSIC